MSCTGLGRTEHPPIPPAGMRYLFLGRALEGRPSYRALGVLLLGQLGVSGLLWPLRRHGSLPALLAASCTICYLVLAEARSTASGRAPR